MACPMPCPYRGILISILSQVDFLRPHAGSGQAINGHNFFQVDCKVNDKAGYAVE
jgi:hypothetical protein